jgi:hypothetical protein
MLKGFSSTKSGKRTSKGYAPNSPEKQPFKQLILKCGILKLMYLFISEAKKLELEILEPCPHHDHKHIVGTYLAEKTAYRKAIANALESEVHGQAWLGNSELPFS